MSSTQHTDTDTTQIPEAKPKKNLKVLKTLYKGHFHFVYKVLRLSSKHEPTEYAAHVYDLKAVRLTDEAEEYIGKLKVMETHPHVVQICSTRTVKQDLIVLSELCRAGRLNVKHLAGKLDEVSVAKILEQSCKGILHLLSHGFGLETFSKIALVLTSSCECILICRFSKDCFLENFN
jgi:hypothetical protein